MSNIPLVHKTDNPKFDTPRWLLLASLALALLGLRNNRASLRAPNGEAEVVEDVEEEDWLELKTVKSTLQTGGEAGAIHNMGAGADEVTEKAQPVAEDMV